jgi:hypothetical protein
MKKRRKVLFEYIFMEILFFILLSGKGLFVVESEIRHWNVLRNFR